MKNPDELLQKIKQLESELKKVKSCKRYWLVWEDKPEIFEEKAKNALPILKEDVNLRIEDSEEKPNNIIIEWDNYHSLSALSYTHKWKIDVIYIDPPYNTGKKDFIYNDNYVDEEDSYKHSKWLSFMSKRLRLAKKLLSDYWVIFISIDDHELYNLKLLCNEIFLEKNFINNFMWLHWKWKKDKNTRTLQQYILTFSKNKLLMKEWSEKKTVNYTFTNPDNDPKWPWFSASVSFSEERSNQNHKNYYKITSPSGKNWERQWQITEQEMIFYIENWDISFWTNPDYSNVPRLKVRPWQENIIIPANILSDFPTQRDANNQIKEFGLKFDNPKPYQLIQYLAKLSSDRKSTVLDFFAWSWTTGQAVMELNKKDWGSRQFILCSSRENTKNEPEKNICKNITYERNKRVIKWYTNSKWVDVDELGGNLRYYTTEFVKADKSIDDLRYNFIDMCDDLLCIKENTFTEVKLKNAVPELRLFKKQKKFTAILYDIHRFQDLVKLLEVLDWKISVYIFSLSKDIFEEELEYLEKNITVQNIPDDILETYKKIFEF